MGNEVSKTNLACSAPEPLASLVARYQKSNPKDGNVLVFCSNIPSDEICITDQVLEEEVHDLSSI